MARVIEHLLTRYPAAHGRYHVSSAPISKYDLLLQIKSKLGLAIEILPEDDFKCDRSLQSARFLRDFDYTPYMGDHD